MYVLTEDEYQEYKSSKTPPPPSVKCPEDGRQFPNANILGHHLKTHVNGFQCNICGKMFKTKHALTSHLKQHPPQVQPTDHSIFESVSPTTTPQHVMLKKVHKQRSVLNFNAKQWLTLT